MKLCARTFASVALVFFSMAVPLVRAGDAPTKRPRHYHHNAPKVELFLGYSHFRGTPTLSAGNRMVGLNGGNASIAFNFGRYLGLVADFGGYNDSELRLTGPAIPVREADADGKVYT
jgi:hypothetical protein